MIIISQKRGGDLSVVIIISQKRRRAFGYVFYNSINPPQKVVACVTRRCMTRLSQDAKWYNGVGKHFFGSLLTALMAHMDDDPYCMNHEV